MICLPCRDWADATEDQVRARWVHLGAGRQLDTSLPILRRELHEADCEGPGQCDCQHRA